MWLFLVGTVVFGVLLYKYITGGSNKDFWKKRGVREIDTSPALSNLDLMLGRKLFTAKDDYCYKQLGPDEKFCGFWEANRPVLMVKDMELIKRVLIKDFDYFVDRRQFFTETEGLMQKQLPSLMGEEWKGVRSSVSPTFTTGKIRRMMDCFNSVGKAWVQEFAKNCKNSGGSVDIGVVKAVNRYTVDVIANTAFGMNTSTIANPDNEFAKRASQITELSLFAKIRFGILINFPRLKQMLGISIFDTSAMDFFDQILEQGLKARMNGTSHRNDFLQLLVEAKKGELKAADAEELDTFEKEAELQGNWQKKQWLTEDIMRAQAVVFFFAGFGTTSSFLTFALYALALNQDIQDKLREEVGKIVKDDGNLDYDEVGRLVYLDMVTCEVLRKFSAAHRLERVCVRDYRDPETGLEVPKGTLVGIPVNAIHNDKEYYEQPDKFYPEHFTPDVKAARNPYAFMPFGVGPRNCIGMRFALIEVKAALTKMVHHFKIDPTAKTPVPLRGVPLGFNETPPPKLELKLTLIKDA